MSRHPVVLCTTVLGGNLKDPVNAVRLQLAYAGVAMATEFNIPVIVIVGDSGKQGKEILAEFTRLGAIAVPQKPVDDPRAYGMYVSRRQCLNEGLRLDAILYWWIEPEKILEMLRKPNRQRLLYAASLIEQDSVDAITAFCPEMNGYPPLQQEYEQGADAEIAGITGLEQYDAYRGPFGGNPKTIEVILSYDGEQGYKHQTTCVLQQLRCLAAGLKVGIVSFPNFWYGHIQRTVEDNDPTIVERRTQQRHLVKAVREYVEPLRSVGYWPPAGQFLKIA